MPSRAIVAALVLSSSVAGCGPSSREFADGAPGDPDAAGPGADGFPVDFSRVYAHSGGELYRIDTITLAPLLVGTLSGLGAQSLTDLAIDRDDRMVGITLDKLVAIDAQNGATTLIRDLSQSASGFTSLSYVPTDLANPSSPERLVAANDQGFVFEIDPTTGDATQIGDYGTTAGGKIRSSGDLIAVHGFGIYATVTIGDTLTDPDYLARIDPATWQATPLGIGTTLDRIFGVGFWRGTIYGFVDTGAGGQFVELDPNTGAATPISSGTVRWYGAGVTTDAPIVE
jgi:hypothetical protein